MSSQESSICGGRKRLALIALAAFLCLAALGPASVVAATGSIAGTVTDAPTGEPIEGAEVCAETFAEEEGAWACGYTETNGTYFIGGLPAGDYRVWFWASNQYESEYFNGKKNWDEADPVVVPSGGQASGVDADMDRTATISGTVLATEDGLGVEEVEVCAYPLNPDEAFSSCGYSDAGGAYSIKGLAAGSYKVEFWAGWTGRGLAFQFYDHRNRYQEADLVSVGEGEWLEGIDADLAPGASITGRLSDLGTGAPIEARVCSIDAISDKLTTCTWSDEDGTYNLGLLPAGNYKVVFSPEFWEFFPEEAFPGEEDDGLPTQFWNNQASIGAASVISLATGASMTGVDAKFGAAPVAPILTPPVFKPPVHKHRKCRRGYKKKLVRGKRRCVKVRKHHHRRHKKRAERPTARFSAR